MEGLIQEPLSLSSPVCIAWTTAVIAVLLSFALYRSNKASKKKNTSLKLAPWPPNGPTFHEYLEVAKPLQWVFYQHKWVQQYGRVFRVASPFPLFIPEQVVVADVQVAKELMITHMNQYRDPVKFTTRPIPIGKVIAQGEGPGITSAVGEEWKWRKQALLKEFHSSRLRNPDRQLLPVIFENAQMLCRALQETAVSQTPIEVDQHTTKLAVNVIFYFLFGRKDVQFDPQSFKKAGLDMTGFVPHLLFHPWHFITKWIPGTKCHQAQAAKDKAWQTVDKVVAAELDRMEQKESGCAMASLLETEPKLRALSKGRLVAELRPIVLAGFETTAHAIAFALGLLAEYPKVAFQIVQEGRQAGVHNIMNSTTDDLGTLNSDKLRKILDQCPTSLHFFQETIRLFPPVPVTGGECLQDCEVTDSSTGTTFGLRKGTGVTFSNAALQRQLEDGHKLDVDRWRSEDRKTHPFLNAFQTGPHVCVGKNLALLEGQVAVLLAATHFTFDFADPLQEKVELDPASAIFSLPKDGMRLKVQKRA